jgi:hypothetical protein
MNDQTKIQAMSEKFAALSALPNVNELRPHSIADDDPPMNAAEFDALKFSMKASGIREPITLFNDQGQEWILDGRNRIAAGIAIKHRWLLRDFRLFTGTLAEARQLAAELNDIRRHLSAEQRKEKAAKLIVAHPTLSSRALAAMCGVSHTTIVRMREQTSEEDKSYDAFVNKWAALSLAHQERFVREHRVDLAEFLRGAA